MIEPMQLRKIRGVDGGMILNDSELLGWACMNGVTEKGHREEVGLFISTKV